MDAGAELGNLSHGSPFVWVNYNQVRRRDFGLEHVFLCISFIQLPFLNSSSPSPSISSSTSISTSFFHLHSTTTHITSIPPARSTYLIFPPPYSPTLYTAAWICREEARLRRPSQIIASIAFWKAHCQSLFAATALVHHSLCQTPLACAPSNSRHWPCPSDHH